MALRFYNTLTQQVQEFAPARDNTVRMYTCGPTVYDFAHIGNFRTFTFVDILRRTLRANGFSPNHVMNITDVDDKIIRNAAAQGKTLEEYTATYTQAFLDDCAGAAPGTAGAAGAPPPDTSPIWRPPSRGCGKPGTPTRATARVYFRIATFPEYGKLSHNDFSGNLAGARVDVDEYEKADARDFALWKAPKAGRDISGIRPSGRAGRAGTSSAP